MKKTFEHLVLVKQLLCHNVLYFNHIGALIYLLVRWWDIHDLVQSPWPEEGTV